jgi:exodeoxyribonuclease V alpha subunit
VAHVLEVHAPSLPKIASVNLMPEIWQQKSDCLFMDSDEATKEQLNFIARVKRFYEFQSTEQVDIAESDPNELYEFRINEPVAPYETELTIPKKFQHVNLDKVFNASDRIQELLSVMKKVHPWSSLHYGLSAFDVVRKLYLEWVPKYFGE